MGKRCSITLAAVLSVLLGAMGCGSDKTSTPVVPDTVAPAAVLDLQGEVQVGAGVSIELNWAASSEPDLSGYHVYRSANGGAWTLVGAELAPTFRDGTVQRGSTYVYEVSAFDTARNESPRVSSGTIVVPPSTTGRGGPNGLG